ncbi:MAG: hypothetical protein PHE54_02855 [Bacilli bacterium]|nr:hypothetical protein [Bacilli bacterium]
MISNINFYRYSLSSPAKTTLIVPCCPVKGAKNDLNPDRSISYKKEKPNMTASGFQKILEDELKKKSR